MNFDGRAEQTELRVTLRILAGCLRRDFGRWAAHVGIKGGNFTSWVQDMVHMGVAIAYDEVDKWDPTRASLNKWLYLKVENQAREDLRKRKRRLELEKQAAVSLALEELTVQYQTDNFEACLRDDSLKGVLSRLSPDQQDVVALYYLTGLTDSEISRIKKMKLGTIQSLRQRALAEARKYYVFLHAPKQEGVDIPAPPARRNRKARDNPDDEGEGHKSAGTGK